LDPFSKPRKRHNQGGIAGPNALAVQADANPQMRPAAMLFLGCVVVLAIGGGLLGMRLLQTSGQSATVHIGPPGLGAPTKTSFGQVEVESVEQIRGLTPKQLAGMTHGIQSLVKADQMQVQMVIALHNARSQAVVYDPAQFVLRLVRRTGRATSYDAVSTSVRAGQLESRSSMETTLGFVIPRFNPKGTQLSLQVRQRVGPRINLDLGPVRPGGSRAEVQAALDAGHHH